MSWEEKKQPFGDSNPHGEHFHHKLIFVLAMQAVEGDASLDSLVSGAALVEPGMWACWSHYGVVGLVGL